MSSNSALTFRRVFQRWLTALFLLQVSFCCWATETIALRQLPDALRAMWNENKPQMNENSRCATAFDSHYDLRKMTFHCSIYMRMAAEAERRAMTYCEQERARKAIAATCRIISGE